jgi:hypothetical protein
MLTACSAPSGPTVAGSSTTNVPPASPTPTRPSAAPADAIARVGDAFILRRDFDRFYLPNSDVKAILDQMIDVELVVQAALAEGATIDESVIDGQVEQLRLAQAGGDDAQFQAFLQENKIADVQELRRLLGRDQ